jgi:tRNA(fMet)-specific endonuclease VapC
LPRFLLDTDICSYIIKRSHPALLTRLQTMLPDDIAVSAVSKAELLYGAEVSPRREYDRIAVTSFLQYVLVLDFPDPAADHYARIRAELKEAGAMIGANDLFLAAHARSLGLTLVTNNTRELRRVSGLLLENWTIG